ncbi:LytTR family DNA-binding domain-containing protein [Periweissella cryptocerci]|nr:LytTR family DNA-binding domain-containing protein [Periweissella cryptocerci]
MQIEFKKDPALTEAEVAVDVRAQVETADTDRLMTYIGAFQTQNKVLLVNDRKRKVLVQVPEDEIISIEVQKDFITIVTKQNMYEERERLYKVLESLSPDKFIQVAKASVINLEYLKQIEVTRMGTTIAVLVNNQEVVVTRTYYKALKQRMGA